MCKTSKNKGKLFSWVKKNYFFIVFLSMIIWGMLSYISNNYEISPKILKIVDNKTDIVNVETIYTIESKFYVLTLCANFFLTFGITLFISMFFTNYFETKEKKEFEEKLQKFQEETAKNAYLSLFHQIVDESFFSIIKEDVIQCKKIRTKAKWIYDIKVEKDESNNDILSLRRTIKYIVNNLSADTQNEEISFSSSSNSFLKTELESIKIANKDNNYIDKTNEMKTVSSEGLDKKEFIESISPNSSIGVIKIVKQTFSRNFIYETQFANCPLADLEIEVNHPENYKFSLSADSLSIKPTKEIDTSDKKLYRFNSAILQGQGIEFFCEEIK